MTAQCSHRSPRGTQCRRSALDGAETCKRHASGYVAPKRAARVVAQRDAKPDNVEQTDRPAYGGPERAAHEWAAHHTTCAVDFEQIALDDSRESSEREWAESRMRGHFARAAAASLAWLLDDSTASAGEADHGAMPHGTTTEPDQLDPVESAEAVDVAWDQRWPVRRTATSVIVTTPSGTHAFGVGFSDDEAERAAREMHERDVEAAEHVNGEIDAPTIVRGAPVPFHVARLDCVAFLASLEDESVDLIVTDPAYESLEKHRAHGTTTRLTADWFAIFKNERFPELLRECFRVLKPGTHLYVYSDQETMFVTKPMAEAAGFTWWKHLVWSKTKRDGDEPAAGMGYHYRASHEVIGFYEKGKRRLNDLGVCDVLPAPRVRGYPTEKPVSVSRTLIEQSSAPGELVVDCFMGSASVGEAALLAGRRFAGCDVAERSIALARERLTRAGGVEVGPPSARAQRSLFG